MRIRAGDSDTDIVSAIKARHDQLKADRLVFEGAWSQIAQYVDPRHDFSLDQTKGQLRRRNLVDTTAADAAGRLAALLHGYMMSPYDPWLMPYAVGLRRLTRRDEDMWFESVQTQMHDFLTATRSSFRSQSIESLVQDVSYGTSIIWMGKSARNGRPYFKALPLSECWIADNDEGWTDTVFREFTLSLREAMQFAPTPGLQAKADAARPDWNEEVRYLWAVMPRENGRRGAMAGGKPWASIIVCLTTNDEVARQSGYDQFPFAVSRFEKKCGEAYGRAPGWRVLPVAKYLNAMKEAVLRAAEQEADPALIDLTGAFETLDRRPGALNKITNGDMGLWNPDKMLARVQESGDVRLAADLIREARQQIEMSFYIDWMNLGDGQHVTAEFVRDRRDLRLRALSPVVSRLEQEKLSPVGERTYPMLLAGKLIDAPPRSLDGFEIAFDYMSPLSRAQKGSRVEAAERSLMLAERAGALDEEALDEINVPLVLREAIGDAGLPERHKRDPREVKARREARRQAQQDAADAQNAETGGRALASAGQGVAALAQAGAAA